MRQIYVIGIANSESDGVRIQRAYGTENEIKNYLMSLINGDRYEDEENFDNGTESIDDLETDKEYLDRGAISGYSTYGDYHIDYVAIPEESIKIKELGGKENE